MALTDAPLRRPEATAARTCAPMRSPTVECVQTSRRELDRAMKRLPRTTPVSATPWITTAWSSDIAAENALRRPHHNARTMADLFVKVGPDSDSGGCKAELGISLERSAGRRAPRRLGQ